VIDNRYNRDNASRRPGAWPDTTGRTLASDALPETAPPGTMPGTQGTLPAPSNGNTNGTDGDSSGQRNSAQPSASGHQNTQLKKPEKPAKERPQERLCCDALCCDGSKDYFDLYQVFLCLRPWMCRKSVWKGMDFLRKTVRGGYCQTRRGWTCCGRRR
jgi:hypothetical protein